MTNRHLAAVGLLLLAALSWFAPGFNGFPFEASDVSDGSGRTAAAVYIVGAALLWFR